MPLVKDLLCSSSVDRAGLVGPFSAGDSRGGFGGGHSKNARPDSCPTCRQRGKSTEGGILTGPRAARSHGATETPTTAAKPKCFG